MKKIFLISMMLVLGLTAMTACSMGSVGVDRNPNGGVDITVTLTESEVNTLITEAITAAAENGRAIRVQNPTVDLQAGQIVLSGDYEQQNGTGNYVNGSVTLAVTTADGRVTVAVTEANIQGVEANDERLTQIADRINEALNSRASRDNGGNVQLTSVSITNDAMSMVVNVGQ